VHFYIFVYIYIYITARSRAESFTQKRPWFRHGFTSIYIYIHIYVYIHTYIYECLYVHTYICICMHKVPTLGKLYHAKAPLVSSRVHSDIYIYIYIHIYIYIYICVCVYVHTYICIYICIKSQPWENSITQKRHWFRHGVGATLNQNRMIPAYVESRIGLKGFLDELRVNS